MEKAVASQQAPYAVDVTAGKEYYWCACGRSSKQPFCDGAHKQIGLRPIPFVAEKTETVYLCGCRASAKQPFCDGTHSKQ